jgi:D-serine deaminase-like pyridoxal phosphate-dependent protein
MDRSSFQTPAMLVDLDILERNIKAYQRTSSKHNKQLWPMIKTHKSTEIAKLQAEEGAAGFLAGTLDECEALAAAGIKNIMYAYPTAGKSNVSRIINLAKACNFYICLDSADAASGIADASEAAGIRVNYLIIIDSGLHRFGIRPDSAAALAAALKGREGLSFAGITTHPGHVYAVSDPGGVERCAGDERAALRTAYESLNSEGFVCRIVSTGSTPTFQNAVTDPLINMYHPGNYVFNDVIQIANGTAEESDCSLTVLSTIISHPCDDIYICDAGSKCLGLDKGAHGNGSITGFGLVKGHPELIVISLSEEVGKLKADADTNIRIGDKIEIIPNHSCSAANMTSFLYGVRNGRFERSIYVDMRGNSKFPAIPG